MEQVLTRAGGRVEVVASLSQGRTAAAQCGLFTHKSVPVIFEPPCTLIKCYCRFMEMQQWVWVSNFKTGGKALTGDEGIGIEKYTNFLSNTTVVLDRKFAYYQRNFLFVILLLQNNPQVLEPVGGTWLSLVKEHIAWNDIWPKHTAVGTATVILLFASHVLGKKSCWKD